MSRNGRMDKPCYISTVGFDSAIKKKKMTDIYISLIYIYTH